MYKMTGLSLSHSNTYIFIEGAHGLLVQGMQVLQRSRGKPDNEVEPICSPSE